MAKRVLLAEDEPNIAESLAFLLERAGFTVEVAPDGRGALESALAAMPDLMMLDVMLPGLDGLSVLKELRADNRTQTLPIIMLTAKGQQEDRDAAVAAGANLFITKPFANRELVDAVQALIADADGDSD